MTACEEHADRWQPAPKWLKHLNALSGQRDAGGRQEDADVLDVFSDATANYQGFGSFHSDNVEVLVSLPESEYKAPAWPRMQWMSGKQPNIDVASYPNAIIGTSGTIWDVDRVYCARATPVEFGKAFLDEHFMITKEFVFVNHGAFGGALSGAQLLKEHLDHYMESQILKFYDRELLPLIVQVVRRLSKFVNALPRNVVLVQNATAGMNSAIRHLIKPRDVVAYLDTEYLSVYKIAYIRCQEVGASLHEIPLNALLHEHDVLGDDVELTKYVLSHLPSGCTVCLLDFITSSSAMLLPVFTHMIPALRSAGVQRIIVDGAHAPLQVELDFLGLPHDAQPDAFVGNFHKWSSVPKASAFMWIRDENVKVIEPAVLSHGAREGLLSSFIWDGTREYSSYLTLPAVLSFWEAQGVDRIRRRCSQLLQDAVDMLTAAFESRRVARHAPFMSLVELPSVFQGRRDVTSKFVQDALHSHYKVEVPVKQIEGRLYLRISAFVYNDESDYGYLRDAVLELAERLRKRPRDEGTPCPQQQVGGCGATASQAKMIGF